MLLASCVFLLAKQSFQRPSRLLRAVPIVPLTLPIYLMHALALLAMYHFVNPMRFPAIIGATLGVLIVCYLAAKTLATIRPLCFLFTGLRFEKASESCNWIYSFRRLRPGRHIK